MKKDVESQRLEVVHEREKLTELEPLRLDWWKELSTSYGEMASLPGSRGNPTLELEWREKAFAAGERAASPHCDRMRFRGVRIGNRASLIECLRKVKPEGWANRCLRLAAECAEIDLAPLKHGIREIQLQIHPEIARHWREIVVEMDSDERAAETLKEFRALAAALLRTVHEASEKPKALREGADVLDKVASCLQQRGRDAESAEFANQSHEWKQELTTRFGDDPLVIVESASLANERLRQLLEALRRAPAGGKAAPLAELDVYARASLVYLEQKRLRISDSDYAHLRGDCLVMRGAALLEAGRYAESEAALRLAIDARTEAVTRARDASDALQKRWDVTDPQLKLGAAIYKQDRADEGRQLRHEAAKSREAIAREKPTPGRLRDSGNAWRDLSDVLDTPDVPVDRISALEKSVELNREGLHLAKSSSASDSELRNCRISTAWALLNLGFRQHDAKHLAEAEAVLREALGIALEIIASGPAPDSSSVRQLTNIRYDLAKTLVDLHRPEEARAQSDTIAAEVRNFEEKAGHPLPEFDDARRRIAELNRILEAVQQEKE